jgi:hypothetical protein
MDPGRYVEAPVADERVPLELVADPGCDRVQSCCTVHSRLVALAEDMRLRMMGCGIARNHQDLQARRTVEAAARSEDGRRQLDSSAVATVDFVCGVVVESQQAAPERALDR